MWIEHLEFSSEAISSRSEVTRVKVGEDKKPNYAAKIGRLEGLFQNTVEVGSFDATHRMSSQAHNTRMWSNVMKIA